MIKRLGGHEFIIASADADPGGGGLAREHLNSLREGFLWSPAPISTVGVGAGNAGQWASLRENLSQWAAG